MLLLAVPVNEVQALSVGVPSYCQPRGDVAGVAGRGLEQLLRPAGAAESYSQQV